ncbi:MAG: diguanylate cyclase [Proteobacteria bacterium]|nr:diguanylate cyclase [Pseudomonadota bacterium]
MLYSNPKKSCVTSLALVLFLGVFCAEAFSHSNHKNILILHSYHQGLEWTDSITQGIQSVFKQDDSNFDIHFEYLDTKRHPDEAYMEKLVALFRLKSVGEDNDVIIVADNNALDFIQKYRDDLYPHVPVVFCGINNFTKDMIHGMDDITGVEEYTDHESTLNLMLLLHPGTKKILVIIDDSRTGVEVKQNFEKTAINFKDRVTVEYFEHFRIADLLEKISSLVPGDLIYITNLNLDKDKRFISYSEGLGIIVGASKVPIYGSWDFYLGKGIVGGMLTSGFSQGQAAALMARKILGGEKPSDIPIESLVPTRYMFDYTYLKKFHIPESSLPQSSVIINKPKSVWEKEHKLILIIGLFPLLAVLILFWKNRKQKRREFHLKQMNVKLDRLVSEKTLKFKEVNDQLNIILNTMPSPVFFKNTQGIYLECNKAFANLILGLSPEEVLGLSIHDLEEKIPGDLAGIYQKKDMELFEKPGIQTYEAQVLCADGVRRDFLFNKATIKNEQGMATGLVGIMVDISKRREAEKEREDLIEELHRANEKLEKLSITDALTGLSNRGHITQRIKEEIRKSERYKSRFSIIMVDLDHFKSINDSYGHHMGDLALQTVARVLKENIRDIDLVGRFGGEEFLILLPNTDLESGFLLAERIRHSIESMAWESDIVRITISGGIAEYQGESDTELFRKADELLYKAKAAGRNRIEKWG